MNRARIYLTCKADHVLAKCGNPASLSRQVVAQIRTLDEFYEFATSHPHDYILSSSTMDFPQEETSDPAIIALCNQIRNAE